MWFHSLYEAGFDALLNLKKYVPEVPDIKQPEWGTVIYRVPFQGGGHGYIYQVPYKSGEQQHWSPRGKHLYAEYGSEIAGYCHTHPVPTYFTKDDTAFVEGKAVAFMINQKGAYWYDGRYASVPKEARFGTFYLN